MHLNDTEIRKLYEEGKLGIDPRPSDIQFQPASLDLRLDGEFRWFKKLTEPHDRVRFIDPEKPIPVEFMERRKVEPNGGAFLLPPGLFVLATTVEVVSIPPYIVARVEGRSSLGRLGLMIHATAGFIDPGFSGQITLEMTNLSPRAIVLRPGMRICQLSFEAMSAPAERPYGHRDLGSKYQHQHGATPSRIAADARPWETLR